MVALAGQGEPGLVVVGRTVVDDMDEAEQT